MKTNNRATVALIAMSALIAFPVSYVDFSEHMTLTADCATFGENSLQVIEALLADLPKTDCEYD